MSNRPAPKSRPPLPRGLSLAVGTLVLLCIGIVYGWSILSAPLAQELGWNSAQLGANFTVTMSCFCLGGVAGSFLTARTSPRATLLLSALLGGGGFWAASLLTPERLPLLYLSYGVAVGLGVGMAYNTVLGVVTGWYQDRKGFASGVLLMGFGASALVLGGLAGALMEPGALGWRGTYRLLGVMVALALVLGGLVLRGREASAASGGTPAEGLGTGEMLRTPAFWVYFAAAVLGSGIGSGIIGHAKFIALEGGTSLALATGAVGALSVCNGLGRLFFGVAYDKLGRFPSLFADIALFLCACPALMAAVRLSSPALALLGLALTGVAYGGVPTISAAFTADRFGPARYAANIGVMNLSILPASFVSLLAGSIQTASGSYFTALLLMLGMALGMGALGFLLRGLLRRAS